MTVTGSIRLLVGGALVLAGGVLAEPLATRLAAAARTAGPDARAVPATPGPVGPGAFPTAPAAEAMRGVPATLAAPDALPVPPPAGEAPHGFPGGWDAAGWSPVGSPPDSTGGLQLDRSPPQPPARLPPVAQEFAQSGPKLGGAYRSTLDVPPPPLLDVAGPPPAVSWAAPRSVPQASPAIASQEVTDVTVPATYRVQDGDDLGVIAGRFYGHPGAAAAIWAANREALPHPDLLPIGAELRLPPPWAVRGHQRPGDGAIEPAAYARPTTAAPVSRGPLTAPGAVPWLAPVAETVPQAGHRAASPAGDAVSVIVGPGENLTALARRIYGDPLMADRIFAVNRDRLRSPDLAVAGMELRLPQPVTAPRP